LLGIGKELADVRIRSGFNEIRAISARVRQELSEVVVHWPGVFAKRESVRAALANSKITTLSRVRRVPRDIVRRLRISLGLDGAATVGPEEFSVCLGWRVDRAADADALAGLDDAASNARLVGLNHTLEEAPAVPILVLAVGNAVVSRGVVGDIGRAVVAADHARLELVGWLARGADKVGHAVEYVVALVGAILYSLCLLVDLCT